MGTNYYVQYHNPVLNRVDSLHLGKSSNGYFTVNGLNFDLGFDELKAILTKDEVTIIDEYDNFISLDKLLEVLDPKEPYTRERFGDSLPYKYSHPYYILYADFS